MSVHDDTFRLTVRVPFIGDEQSRFRAFLKATGRKAGPFLHSEAMKRVNEWESIESGRTQEDFVKLQHESMTGEGR